LRRSYLGCERFAQVGYISLLAVDPGYRGQGIGSRLLRRAEDHLAVDGARSIALGGSFHHAVAGVPEALPLARAFFERRGYQIDPRTVWDVQRDVRHFSIPERVGEDLVKSGISGRVVAAHYGVSAEPEATASLLEFLHAEFPGRWFRDVAHAFGRLDGTAQVMTLFDVGGSRAVGFTQIHPPGSPGALRWQAFDPDVAAIGPVGVARELKGKGLGLAVVALAADHLKRLGARRVVIDWTDLLDFYGKLGFEPWLSYVLARKTL